MEVKECIKVLEPLWDKLNCNNLYPEQREAIKSLITHASHPQREEIHYKGYTGSVEYSEEDKVFHGKLLHLTDLVTYESESKSGLLAEFTFSVDDYLETIAQIKPQREALDVYKLTSIIYECKRNGKDAGYTALEIYETFGRDKREALDEEKVCNLVEELERNGDLPLNTTERILIKAICAKFGKPSLEDVLSALPEKIDNITPTLMNANHVCDCYNMAIDACIVALKGLWK